MTTLLSQALAAGDADSARQIQVQMAALDAALKREGLGVNLAEFGAQLNQNAALAGLNG
jgi:dihydrodipicolinate synthase/N-acetylneuraminate lyase